MGLTVMLLLGHDVERESNAYMTMAAAATLQALFIVCWFRTLPQRPTSIDAGDQTSHAVHRDE
jgi:hypothetical protein